MVEWDHGWPSPVVGLAEAVVDFTALRALTMLSGKQAKGHHHART